MNIGYWKDRAQKAEAERDRIADERNAYRSELTARTIRLNDALAAAESATAEAIAAFIDGLSETSRTGAIIKVENRTLDIVSGWIRSGAWRKERT